MAEVIEKVRAQFVFFNPYTLRKELVEVTWSSNDFGRWGWNLKRNYQRTTMYIHTSPDHEQATAEHRENDIKLSNSHGCVHIKPADRDKMEQAGYLKEGAVFEVRRYGEVGPP